jgi:hypothetical protein
MWLRDRHPFPRWLRKLRQCGADVLGARDEDEFGAQHPRTFVQLFDPHERGR